MKMVVDSQGWQSYKMVQKTKEIKSIFKYLNNMFIYGACYLRHRPEQGPEFLQYLFNILASNKDYTWTTVLDYDCNFRTHRAKYPSFSWAQINSIAHTKLNKMSNQRTLPYQQREQDCFHHNTSHPCSQSEYCPHQGEFHSRGYSGGLKLCDESDEPCGRYNMGTCKSNNCKFRHVCSYCHKPGHTELNCLKNERNNWRR